MIIVGVTGMPGSGKSVAARRLAEVLGWPVYSMGDIVRREVVRRGLELTSPNIERVARLLREEMGEAAVARLLVDEIRRSPPASAGIVVDGMRSVAEARVLAGMGRLCIVAVHASPRTRYRRIMARSRRGDAVSWEQFVERDTNNLRLGIGSLIALADYMIVNESGIEELTASVDRVAREVLGSGGEGCSGGRY